MDSRRRATGFPHVPLGLLGLLIAFAACASTTTATTATPATGSAAPTTPTTQGFILRSTAFADGATIPTEYGCTAQGGQGVSPPLSWSGVPAGATTLVLVVHDPDAPGKGGFTHLVTTFPATTTGVADRANTAAGAANPMREWQSPCPPSGEHRYQFTLYAFGPSVTIPPGAGKTAIDALIPQALGATEIVGRFAKQG
jgi:Raf kinase inhibitor-like YbhB/YbcL family protein